MPAWLLPAAIAAYGAYQSAKEGGKADEREDRAVALAEKAYAERQPLRDSFIQGVQQPLPQAPDLGSVFADPSNPFFQGGFVPPQIPSPSFSPPTPLGPLPGEIPRRGGMVDPGSSGNTGSTTGVMPDSGDAGVHSIPIRERMREDFDPLGGGRKPTAGDGDMPGSLPPTAFVPFGGTDATIPDALRPGVDPLAGRPTDLPAIQPPFAPPPTALRPGSSPATTLPPRRTRTLR